MIKKGQIIHGNSGEDYIPVSRLGSGGQAVVWKVRCVRTGTLYAYKHYKHNTMNVRANIEDLIRIRVIKDKDGNTLCSAVLPIDLVEAQEDAFGYIMDVVDLKDYTTVAGAWSGNYPDVRTVCRIVLNFARFFEALHLTYGMCYKDVNEGNIFFHPRTGEIRIIDNDNIGYSGKFTIKGTNRYIAPEIYSGTKPDAHSDRFSFAVFVFRLLTGGFPFDGPASEAYCRKNNVLAKDAAPVIYGKNALFVWHPSDTSNSFARSSDPRLKAQAAYWKRLPAEIKDLFVRTFAENIAEDRRCERPSDAEWISVFTDMLQRVRVCPHCGKLTFDGTHCFECGKRIAGKKPAPAPSPVLKTPVRHSVHVRILSAGEAKKDTVFRPGDQRKGNEISRSLPADDLFRILYSKKEKKTGMRNLSKAPWTVVLPDKTKTVCNPGDVQPLEKGMMIRIIPRTAQINILDIRKEAV